MPSVVIPFGAPDPDRLDGLTNTLHFQGSITGGNQSGPYDYDDLVDSYGTLTAADALATDDTATYAHADNAGLDAAVGGRYAELATEAVYHQHVRGGQSVAQTIPDGSHVDRVALVAVARAAVAGANIARLGLQTYPPGGGGQGYSFDLTISAANTWQRFEKDVTGLAVATLATPAQNVAYFTATPSGALTTAAWYDVAFLGVLVAWTPPFTPHPTYNRIVQRGSDGLGMTGGRRIVQNRTMQSTNRRGAAIR